MENTQNTESNSDFEFWMEFHRENELLDGDDLVFCNCAGGPNIEDETKSTICTNCGCPS